MTRLTLVALLLTLGLMPHSPVFVDASRPVVVDAGEELFIALASNETTGYTWSQMVADGKILAYEGNVYEPSTSGMPGASGQQIFIFHANRSGTTTIAFNYGRPFEPNAPPAKSTTFSVTVH